MRKASTEIRFSQNLWVTFIRPLFDYTVPIYQFATSAWKEDWLKLYRTTMKKMLDLPLNIPNKFPEIFIMYDPSTLPQKTLEVAILKTKACYRQWVTDRIDLTL